MQTTLLTLGITLILALVTALVGPAFVDWGRFRTNFEAQASRLAGQPVRISGQINVRLLPIPMVRLQGIDVGPPAAKGAMSAREIDAQLSLPSLMRGQLRATVLRVDAPRFALQRDAQGRVSGPPLVASDVTIDRIVVHEGRIRVADAASAAGSVVDHGLSMATYAPPMVRSAARGHLLSRIKLITIASRRAMARTAASSCASALIRLTGR